MLLIASPDSETHANHASSPIDAARIAAKLAPVARIVHLVFRVTRTSHQHQFCCFEFGYFSHLFRVKLPNVLFGTSWVVLRGDGQFDTAFRSPSALVPCRSEMAYRTTELVAVPLGGFRHVNGSACIT